MGDLVISGGKFGIWAGNQQYVIEDYLLLMLISRSGSLYAMSRLITLRRVSLVAGTGVRTL